MEYFRIYMHLMEEDFKQNYGSNSEHIKQAIKNLQEGYDKHTMAQHKTCLNYDIDNFRHAYLYQYATCHSKMVEYFVYDVFEKCYLQFTDLFSSNLLRITCLGGGPGVDAVAFLMAASKTFDLSSFSSIEITVIDLCSDWKKTMYQLFDKLDSFPEFHIFSILQCRCTFINADLTEPWFPMLHKAVQNADFVSMVKFVSAADGCSVEGKVPELLGKVCRSMKDNAMLLFIDNASGGFYEMVDEAANQCQKMDQIYGPNLHQLYEMPWDTMKWHCSQYRKLFGSFPLSATRVSVGVWMKNSRKNNLVSRDGPAVTHSQSNQLRYSIRNDAIGSELASIMSLCSEFQKRRLLSDAELLHKYICIYYAKDNPTFAFQYDFSNVSWITTTVILPCGRRFASSANTLPEAAIDTFRKALAYFQESASITECVTRNVLYIQETKTTPLFLKDVAIQQVPVLTPNSGCRNMQKCDEKAAIGSNVLQPVTMVGQHQQQLKDEPYKISSNAKTRRRSRSRGRQAANRINVSGLSSDNSSGPGSFIVSHHTTPSVYDKKQRIESSGTKQRQDINESNARSEGTPSHNDNRTSHLILDWNRHSRSNARVNSGWNVNLKLNSRAAPNLASPYSAVNSTEFTNIDGTRDEIFVSTSQPVSINSPESVSSRNESEIGFLHSSRNVNQRESNEEVDQESDCCCSGNSCIIL